jgi:hypothetical protein
MKRLCGPGTRTPACRVRKLRLQKALRQGASGIYAQHQGGGLRTEPVGRSRRLKKGPGAGACHWSGEAIGGVLNRGPSAEVLLEPPNPTSRHLSPSPLGRAPLAKTSQVGHPRLKTGTRSTTL